MDGLEHGGHVVRLAAQQDCVAAAVVLDDDFLSEYVAQPGGHFRASDGLQLDQLVDGPKRQWNLRQCAPAQYLRRITRRGVVRDNAVIVGAQVRHRHPVGFQQQPGRSLDLGRGLLFRCPQGHEVGACRNLRIHAVILFQDHAVNRLDEVGQRHLLECHGDVRLLGHWSGGGTRLDRADPARRRRFGRLREDGRKPHAACGLRAFLAALLMPGHQRLRHFDLSRCACAEQDGQQHRLAGTNLNAVHSWIIRMRSSCYLASAQESGHSRCARSLPHPGARPLP